MAIQITVASKVSVGGVTKEFRAKTEIEETQPQEMNDALAEFTDAMGRVIVGFVESARAESLTAKTN